MATDRLIAQRFQVIRRLGAGGMGEVYLCTDLELRRPVALKRSHTGDTGQIRREAKLGAGLRHPHIVPVFDVVTEGDERWLVMEYVPSRTLDEVLRTDGPLPPERIRSLGAQLADALAAMHAQGMVHRDVKPGNVLIADDGSARLTDLGVARWTDATVTGGAIAAGTTGFLAPEVAAGDLAEAPADVFGLGATLYASATGRSPWGDSGHGPYAQLQRAATYALEPMAPAGELAEDISALMSRGPADRPRAEQARDRLLSPADHQAIRAPAASGTKAARRRRAPWLLAGTATVAAAVVALVLVSHRSSDAASHAADSRHPASAGRPGDLRDADPCALLDPDSLHTYGMARLEPNYGNFNHCDVLVDTGGKGDIVDVSLEFETSPDQDPPRKVIGKVEPEAPTENLCRRTIELPDRVRVVVAARQVNDKRAPLCQAAEAAALSAHGTLVQGQLARRTHRFAAASLANRDACALISADQIRTALGGAAEPEPGFGHWSCLWSRGKREIVISFGREWPVADDPLPGTRTRIGGRVAFVDTGDDSCHVTIAHRRYAPDDASPDGTPQKREETVDVSLEGPGAGAPQSLCAATTVLAKGLARRLPAAS